ncbi:flagellar assembly protein FliX [Phenylobacterium terrae]|uniref:Flagellar assembly protein FliX n=1 Tax=Phenylobacterium terrae TaxID=2665495 RepID=A0ABW4N5X4_9CAUL
MKVSGPSGVGSTKGSGPSRPAGGSGFRINIPSEAAGPAQVGGASGVSGVASVDALLALQASGGPLERRRRAVGRAGRILDVLDEVRIALLGGELNLATLERLRRAVREERDQTDDPALEAVLNEIETRAAVELAKHEGATRAA